MKNYFRYLPPALHEEVWGGSVTAIGHTRMVADSPYPPARHPIITSHGTAAGF
jgi:hypothetical protein